MDFFSSSDSILNCPTFLKGMINTSVTHLASSELSTESKHTSKRMQIKKEEEDGWSSVIASDHPRRNNSDLPNEQKANHQEKSRWYSSATLHLRTAFSDCSYDSSRRVGEIPEFTSLEQRESSCVFPRLITLTASALQLQY